MRPIEELIDTAEPALPFVLEAAKAVPGRCVVHPPGPGAEQALFRTQVTTRSPMGAILYQTGGISVLGGWLRILGGGSGAIPRNLADWNEGRMPGIYLVADDAFGGFFALDGGALGQKQGTVCYFAPDTLRWESLECNYSQFLTWACSDFRGFYDGLVFPGCEEAIAGLGPDRCLFFYPPLWSKERGEAGAFEGRSVPVEESWGSQMEIATQLDAAEQ